MNRARAWLQLVRVPNLFTAAADALAGALFVWAGSDRAGEMALLVAASICFYAGGVVLNDVCDAPRDAEQRRHRSIPSGAVSRKAAAWVSVALLAAGCFLTHSVSHRARSVGLALAACIVLYDVVLKRTFLAPAVMGMCRALNLLLGMTLADAWGAPVHWYAAGLMWLYVTSVTFFARTESSASSTARIRLGGVGVAAAVLGLVGVQAFLERANTWYLLLVGVLMGQIVVPAHHAARTAAPADVQRAVRGFVLSLVLFDACLVFASRGPVTAAAVALLLVPAILLGRAFPVT